MAGVQRRQLSTGVVKAEPSLLGVGVTPSRHRIGLWAKYRIIHVVNDRTPQVADVPLLQVCYAHPQDALNPEREETCLAPIMVTSANA
jgi:hypothetical protein